MIEHLDNTRADLEISGKPQAHQALDRLMAGSKFSRQDTANPDTVIEAQGERYTIEMVPDGSSETLSNVQNLFVKTFGEEEVDPEEILRAAVDGKDPWGRTDSVKYRIHTIKDSKGEVISTVAGGRLELRGADGKPLGKQMFMVAYAVTDEQARQGGLAREAYISAIMQAAKEAQAEGKQLALAAGECTSASEKFWNSVGWKRAYGRSGDALKELRYVQPALDFDPATGMPTEGSGAVSEHMMIDSFNGMPPDKDDVLATVRAFYEWCNTWPPEAFENPEAIQKHQQHVVEIWQKFKQQVVESEGIEYLDAAQREQALASGWSIEEHRDADHGEAGPEDF